MRFTNFMEQECRKALLAADWRYCQQPTNATTQIECSNTLLGTECFAAGASVTPPPPACFMTLLGRDCVAAGSDRAAGSATATPPPPAPPPPRRAFFTLVARGEGSYIKPTSRDVNLPSYIRVVLPLLCTFRRTGSAYRLGVLAYGLAEHEHATMLTHGADFIVDISSTDLSAARPFPQHDNATWPNCLPIGAGGWAIAGRSDGWKTLLKIVLYRQTDYDEVVFLDADTAVKRTPDALFNALSRRSHRKLLMNPFYSCGRRWLSQRLRCATLEFAALPSGRQDCRPAGSMEAAAAPFLLNHSETKRYRSRPRVLPSWPGFQTSVVVTRPSAARADALLRRALTGQFTPNTRTEQDVIDSEYFLDDRCDFVNASGMSFYGGGQTPERSCALSAHLNPGFVSRLVVHHRLHGVSPTGYDHLKHHRSSRAPAGRHARAAPHDEDTSIAQQLLILDTCNRAALGADGWEPTAAQRRRWTKEVAKAWRNVSSGVPLADYKWAT